MGLSPPGHGGDWRRRLRDGLVTTLVLAALAGLAVLAERHRVSADWTAVGRNTLGERSLSLLDSLKGGVAVTVFAREERLVRAAASELLDRYERAFAAFSYRFVDPDREPELFRESRARRAGDAIVEYEGRSETLRGLSEAGLTAALERLARHGDRWVVALTGHGERDLRGKRNFDLGRFGEALAERGYAVRPLALETSIEIPHNTALLVIADARVSLSSGAVSRLLDYLAAGGNLLWLREPGVDSEAAGLDRVLGIQRLPGQLEDAAAASLYDLDDARFLVIGRYPPHPVTGALDLQTLFPGAAALAVDGSDNDFRAQALMRTSPLARRVDPSLAEGFAAVEASGTPFAIALTRTRPDAADGEQRAIVVGDADFLANAYVGNGDNLQLGLAMTRWLSGADELLQVKSREAPDLRFEMSQPMMLGLAFGALFVLPMLLLTAGFVVWYRRHRR